MGADCLSHPDDAVSPAELLLEQKVLIDKRISKLLKGYRFMTIDINDSPLQPLMEDNKYMRFQKG